MKVAGEIVKIRRPRYGVLSRNLRVFFFCWSSFFADIKRREGLPWGRKMWVSCHLACCYNCWCWAAPSAEQLLVLSSSGSENEETRHCSQSSLLLHSLGVNYNHTRFSNTLRLYTCWKFCTETNDPRHCTLFLQAQGTSLSSIMPLMYTTRCMVI